MADAWDFGPGNVGDAGTWNTPAYQASVAGGIDFGGGWSQTFQDLAKIGASTWAQTTLMQSNVQGQQYIEGQRIAAAQLAAQSARTINPNFLLLAGAGLVVYMLAKG